MEILSAPQKTVHLQSCLRKCLVSHNLGNYLAFQKCLGFTYLRLLNIWHFKYFNALSSSLNRDCQALSCAVKHVICIHFQLPNYWIFKTFVSKVYSDDHCKSSTGANVVVVIFHLQSCFDLAVIFYSKREWECRSFWEWPFARPCVWALLHIY